MVENSINKPYAKPTIHGITKPTSIQFKIALLRYSISNSIIVGGLIMSTTLLLTPYIFRPSYGPFELLLAWFVDVAIQFVMLSQYGRG